MAKLINTDNLEKMIAFMASVKDEELDMNKYPSYKIRDEVKNVERPLRDFGETGCILGHCAHLGKGNLEQYMGKITGFHYEKWAEDFVFTRSSQDEHHPEANRVWDFMFSSHWGDIVSDAIERMQYMVDHDDVPEWFNSVDISTYIPYSRKELRDV